MLFWKYLFWLCLVAIIYVYCGYPLLAYVLSLIRTTHVRKKNITPTVTILIAAHNEAQCIDQTLRNKLALNYPAHLKEIIVISDGSTDGTDTIVQRYHSECVTLLRQEPRAGKTAALNLGVTHAKGEILVFSDANSIYAVDALQALVRNFADPSVGYVTGKMVYAHTDGSLVGDGCTVYMKYENFLRATETRIGSVVGVDGGIDAVRKALYRPMRADQLPDFVLPLRVIEQGYRVVYESEALLRESALVQARDEYRMRVRVSLRSLWAIFDMRHLLSLRRYRLFALQLWSHKAIRYLCFLFMIILYGCSAMLLNAGWLYLLAFIAQSAAYGVVGYTLGLRAHQTEHRLIRFLTYFVLINFAAGHAFLKFIMGHKQVLWNPRKG